MRSSSVFLLFFSLFLQTACSQYTRDMFWENKVVPTPYEKAVSMVKPDRWSDDDVTYSWLGHATVLINFYGTTILTDPVLLKRIAPPEMFDNLFGIKRIKELPLDPEDLPDIDLVLISHPHYDHLDLASLRLLAGSDSFKLVVPGLTRDLVSEVTGDENMVDVVELDWMVQRVSGAAVSKNELTVKNLTISAFRVEHYGYTSWGKRQSKRGFNGYLIGTKNNADDNKQVTEGQTAHDHSSHDRERHHQKTLAFFGDTSFSGYRDEWGEVLDRPVSIDWRSRFDKRLLQRGIDLCVIPIGDSYYYWNHISPENAVRLANVLNCKKLLPIHYATFILTPPEKEKEEPKQLLLKTLRKNNQMDLVRCSSYSGENKYPDIGVSCRN